jgi:hypothetical protein
MIAGRNAKYEYKGFEVFLPLIHKAILLAWIVTYIIFYRAFSRNLCTLCYFLKKAAQYTCDMIFNQLLVHLSNAIVVNIYYRYLLKEMFQRMGSLRSFRPLTGWGLH